MDMEESWGESITVFKRTVVCISGGFDPIHIGHIRMINAASVLGDLVVILNTDDFLIRKKGFIFTPFRERKEIIENIKGVTEVVRCIDSDMTVCKTLEKVKPNIFCNGGDRTYKNIPEKEVCERIGCSMLFGIGGGKVQSSSDLVQKFIKGLPE